jgi:hypothetical protein
MVNFYESRPHLVVPSVHTYLFVGEETHGGKPMWLFREPPSARPPEAEQLVNGEPEEAECVTALEDRQLWQILDIQDLIRKLTGLIDFHPLVKPTDPLRALSRREAFPEIAPQVERLLASDESSAVTITIKYTDDGFSIGKSADERVRWTFFPKAKIETEREARIRAMFRDQQTAPVEDYLSDAGQRRVLGYALPRDDAKTIALCGRLLREIYEMREDDELVFSFHPKRREDSA